MFDEQHGWPREELATAEQMLLGNAEVIRQVFPSITEDEMHDLFEACAEWFNPRPLYVPATDLRDAG